MQKALGALLVAWAAPSCAELEELITGWGGALTPLLRKRISRHTETCDRCADRQRTLVSPGELNPAYTGLAFLPVPAVVWARLDISGWAQPGVGPQRAVRPRASWSRATVPLVAVAVVVVTATATTACLSGPDEAR